MGQRMRDEPIVHGDDCLSCFAEGETPEYIYVRFSLIERCDWAIPWGAKIPPNDRLFKLTQNPSVSCEWIYNQSGWEIEYRAFFPPTGGSYLDLYDDAGMLYFRDNRDACEPEGTVFHNEFIGCVGDEFGSGGIGVVTWTPQATGLLTAISLAKGNDLFQELFPKSDGKLVYKFCRKQDGTNIKILFEL